MILNHDLTMTIQSISGLGIFVLADNLSEIEFRKLKRGAAPPKFIWYPKRAMLRRRGTEIIGARIGHDQKGSYEFDDAAIKLLVMELLSALPAASVVKVVNTTPTRPTHFFAALHTEPHSDPLIIGRNTMDVMEIGMTYHPDRS